MRILVVEDNCSDMMLLNEFIVGRDDAPDMQCVPDGMEALDYLYKRGQYVQAERPDMVLLDLGLPRISGYEVLRRMKEDKALADIPVVVLSTSRNPLDEERSAMLGAANYVSKPHNLKGYEMLVDKIIHGTLLHHAA